MPKINIYLPDDLAEAVKDAGIPVSAVCQRALESAVRRVTALREVTSGSAGIDTEDGPVAVHFTRRAMTVLEAAQQLAAAAGASAVHTGQLLTALTDGDNMAVRVLTALEITPREIRAALDRRTAGDATAPGPARPSGDAPSPGQHLGRALELAAAESSALGNSYIGCEHLLLGLIAEPDGTGGSVLRSLGADLRVTRRTVAAALAGWGAHQERARSQPPAGLSAVVRAELAPLVARIERLEQLAPSA
jgi:ATP-dependent Clp protease ATP-binding subunit ClpA